MFHMQERQLLLSSSFKKTKQTKKKKKKKKKKRIIMPLGVFLVLFFFAEFDLLMYTCTTTYCESFRIK